MSAITILAILGVTLLAVGLAGLLWQRGWPQSLLQRHDRGAFHAVTVKAAETACAASRQMEGRRFLSAEAPRIPLAECSCAETCGCIYTHFDDRRYHDRRNIYATKKPVSDRRHMGRRGMDGLQPYPLH